MQSQAIGTGGHIAQQDALGGGTLCSGFNFLTAFSGSSLGDYLPPSERLSCSQRLQTAWASGANHLESELSVAQWSRPGLYFFR